MNSWFAIYLKPTYTLTYIFKKLGEMMAQVTIYINSNLEERIKVMAGSLDISLSKLISRMLEEKFSNEWHPSVKELAGSWKSFPSLDEIRETTGKDAERESF